MKSKNIVKNSNYMNLNNRYFVNNIGFKNTIKKSEKTLDILNNFMIDLDNNFKKNNKNNKSYDFNNFIEIIKDNKKKTKYAYTFILNDASNVTGLLNLMYSIRHINKSKYDFVLFIQDKPYYETNIIDDSYIKFEGIDKSIINDISQYFDVIINFNMIQILTLKKEHSKNFLSKMDGLEFYNKYISIFILFSYTQYKKLLFVQNNLIINKSIDYIFDKYDKSIFTNDYNHYNYKGGLFGNIILIIPKKYYFPKILYLIDNFQYIFKDNDLIGTYDQIILYFTVFPNWNTEKLPKFFINYNYSTYPDIDFYKEYKDDYYIDYYWINNLPYAFHNKTYLKITERNNFSMNFINFKKWDLCAKRLITDFPKLNKYFEYIKTYRNTYF
jgi:hypothetical protein